MYTITVYDSSGIEKHTRRYKEAEKAKAMADWDRTVDCLMPNEEKGVLRGPTGILSEYSPHKWKRASFEHGVGYE